MIESLRDVAMLVKTAKDRQVTILNVIVINVTYMHHYMLAVQ